MKNFEEAKKVFTSFLKKKKLKSTYERKKILEEIFKMDEHFDAEGLYLKFREANINISRATVYRTLDLLVESGIISKCRFFQNTFQYERTIGNESHSHLICKECGKIEEFTDERIDMITKEICEKFDFTSYQPNFRIFGVCSECRNKSSNT